MQGGLQSARCSSSASRLSTACHWLQKGRKLPPLTLKNAQVLGWLKSNKGSYCGVACLTCAPVHFGSVHLVASSMKLPARQVIQERTVALRCQWQQWVGLALYSCLLRLALLLRSSAFTATSAPCCVSSASLQQPTAAPHSCQHSTHSVTVARRQTSENSVCVCVGGVVRSSKLPQARV